MLEIYEGARWDPVYPFVATRSRLSDGSEPFDNESFFARCNGRHKRMRVFSQSDYEHYLSCFRSAVIALALETSYIENSISGNLHSSKRYAFAYWGVWVDPERYVVESDCGRKKAKRGDGSLEGGEETYPGGRKAYYKDYKDWMKKKDKGEEGE